MSEAPPSEREKELASLAVNAANALRDEKRHYEIACQDNARLREELRKAKRAVERVQRRLDAWEQKLPENVRRDTIIEVLRGDLGEVA
ncbi:hypothetical protein [Streptomyces sp. AA1529]|uniref:hypothetical protein n=1 Tax=Streptomyces sp. AA1529 TaxID=1203257 RepID=UPI0003190BE2|nr:hypothetical protein [Streptomyces sp. AA1529]